MPRNLSESQLVQISSKALSNVAGQFSKLGKTLNPNKNQTTNNNRVSPTSPINKTAQINPQVMRQSQSSIDKCMEAAEKPLFTVGGGDKQKFNSTSGSDSEENDSSIYEPEIDSDTELAISAMTATSNYNKVNNFLPSVGIVMSNASQEAAVAAQQQQQGSTSPTSDELQQLLDKDNMAKHAEDMSSFSISSVANNVTFPTGLLENAPTLRPITPNPQICVRDMDMGGAVVQAEEAYASEQQSRSVFYRDLS